MIERMRNSVKDDLAAMKAGQPFDAGNVTGTPKTPKTPKRKAKANDDDGAPKKRGRKKKVEEEDAAPVKKGDDDMDVKLEPDNALEVF
jgi:hypothetical protein